MLTHTHAVDRIPERVVMIGAGGFIGREIHRQLAAAGIAMLALTSEDVDFAAPGAAASLRAQLKPNDAVVMLAALNPERGRDAPTLRRNLTIAETVCGVIATRPVAHIVYISSEAVYSLQTPRLSEETLAAPDNLYGLMHRTRELMFVQAAGTVPFAVLRPTMISGVGDPHNAYGPNRFRRQATEEGRIVLGGKGEETRDHIFIADAAALIVRVLLRKSQGVLNLATGTSWSFVEIARLVAARAEKPVEVVFSPRTLPITHRSFDTTATMKAFPGFTFTSLPKTLDEILAEKPIR